LIERGDNINPEGAKKTGFYPQVVRYGTINIDQLALRIAKGKRLQAFETKATIELLLACIEDELLLGNHVCLDGFGTFSLTAQSKRPITDPDEIRAESIEVKRVVFNPSKPLSKRMKIAKFVRATKNTNK
jgi:predicted histone-like DNA-binding protein